MSGLIWNGDAVEAEVVKRLSDALAEIGLRIEAEAKQQLWKGHGVLTGTLRRSIHATEPNYNFPADNVKASGDSPERGGKEPEPKQQGSILWVAIGSGLVYAMAVHQGHGGFSGYHYLTNALEKVKPLVNNIVRKHLKK
jgi:hypothetical protein